MRLKVKTKEEIEIIKEKETIPKETNKEKKPKKNKNTLVLDHQKHKTSVFLHDKLLFEDSAEKPFIYLKIDQEEEKRKNNKKIQKKFPLRCCKAQRKENQIELTFYGRGENIKITLKEVDHAIIIKIKKSQLGKAVLSFPRGTNEEISYINEEKTHETKEKDVFSTRISNFYSSSGCLYSLKTAKEWDMEFTPNEKRIIVKGEKAKINIFFGKTNEDVIKYYKYKDKLTETHQKKKNVYICVKSVNYKRKTRYLINRSIDFDGVIWEYSAKQKHNKEIIEYCKKIKKSLIIKIKPYIQTKQKNKENIKHLIKQKNGKLFTQNINGKKYYAVDLSNSETRKWLANKLRDILNEGIKGFIAEKGKIDYHKTNLPEQNTYCLGEVWYIIWQKTVREVIDEYPYKEMLVRNNGAYSYRYGKVLTDEKRWKDIDCDIEALLQRHTECGMGKVNTEIGGIIGKCGKSLKKAKKWFDLTKDMDLIIIGNIRPKTIAKVFKAR